MRDQVITGSARANISRRL